MSLKELLHQKIHEMGYLSYGEMCQFVVEEGYKVDTASRRLRGLCADKSEAGLPQTPQIAAITSKSKRNTEYISGWEWIAASKADRFILEATEGGGERIKNMVEAINKYGSLPPAFKVAPKETKNYML